MLNEMAITIRSRRLKLGLSEQQLSNNLGIDPFTLRSIEQGSLDPDVQLVYAIARELFWSPSTLVSRAESLTLASRETRKRMLHSLKTRRQLESLELQHYRLYQQLDRLKRQAESLASCQDLINSSQKKLCYLTSRNLVSINRRLDEQRDDFNATMSRLAQIKQACDEHEMFMQRRRAHRLSVVR
jgi:DNA-binding XRE family transcriptional regulator